MDNIMDLVIFTIEDQRFALTLSNVERVIKSVAFLNIPSVPEYISGAINYLGEFIPLVNLRKLFNLNPRDIDLDDHFIIVNSSSMKLSLWIDEVDEVLRIEQNQVMNTDKIMLESGFFEGLIKLNDSIVFIQDIERILSHEQISRLKEALQKIRESEKIEKSVFHY
ncbi:MAG: chemotaxis protein CheW [Bacteroidales bacterium]